MASARFPRSLRQVTFLLLGLSFLPLLAVMVAGFLAARQDSYRAAEERVAALTQIALLAEQRLIANVRQTLFVLSHAPAVARGDPEMCSATLREVMLSGLVYTNLGVTDAEGNVICSAQPLAGSVNVADRAYFVDALNGLDFGVGVYQVGRVTGKPAINFAYPVMNYRRTYVTRMVYGALDITWLGGRLRANPLPEDSRAWVFDEDGVVLASVPGEDWLGRSVVGSALGDAMMAPGDEMRIVEVDDLDGVRRLYGIAPLWLSDSGIRLRIAVGVPLADAFVEVNHAFIVNVGLLLAGTLLLTLLSFILLRRSVLRPISQLADVSRRLAADDRTVRAPVESGIVEFAVLGSAFNDMARAIGEREDELARHIDKVEQMGRRFRVLSAINQTIVHAADEPTMFETACEAIVRYDAGRAAWISCVDENGGETALAVAAVPAASEVTERLGDPACSDIRRRSLLAAQVLVVEIGRDALDDKIAGIAALLGATRYIGHPILVDGKVAAVLNILAGEDAVWLDQAGLDLVEEVAGDLGFAMVNFDKDRHISRLAYSDHLTGLANRSELIRRAELRVQEAARTGVMLPMMKIELLSLDQRIKRFGHSVGDFVLRHFAEALRQNAPADSLVARSGEFTFTVMFALESTPQTLPARIEAMLERLPDSLQFGAQEIALEFNAGIASYPEDGETALALMQACMLALDSLQRGRNGVIAYHSTRLSVEAQERWQIENLLGRAVARGELSMRYQPTKDLNSGALLGVEALVRWRNPDLGDVSPGRFIPIAEQSGQINEIGRWVFAETCRQMQAWIAAGMAPAYASVNVSVLQLYDPSFVSRVAELLDRYPEVRGRIAVEITETAMMDDFDISRRVLGELKELGMAIFVDDFGTGYSSLSYLRRLPVDTLKIDLVFTSELGSSEEALSVIKAIVALGHSLGLMTLAEGIETVEQEDTLISVGCDVGQGYLIGRPLLPDELATMFRAEAERNADEEA